MLKEVLDGSSSVTTKQLWAKLGLVVIHSEVGNEGDDPKMEVKMEMEGSEDDDEGGKTLKEYQHAQKKNIESGVNCSEFPDGVPWEKQLNGMFHCIEHECSKEFKCVELVRKHWRTMHCAEMQAMVPCEHCGKAVAKKLIARHIHQKHSVGPFKCDQCERSFSSSAHLKLHQDSRHDPTRPCLLYTSPSPRDS